MKVTDEQVLDCLKDYRAESSDASEVRLRINERNRGAFWNEQDWSDKSPGQSREFLPKTASALEHFIAFVRQGLAKYGDRLTIERNDSGIDSQYLSSMLDYYLRRVVGADGKRHDVSTIVGDLVHQMLLESLGILKIHVAPATRYVPDVMSGAMTKRQSLEFICELVPSESIGLDPTGRETYFIHTYLQDWYRLKDSGVYPAERLNKVTGSWSEDEVEDRRTARHRGSGEYSVSTRRRQVLVEEIWGTFLDNDGNVIAGNSMATVANEKEVILPARQNPAWDGEPPFIVGSLLRVPHSVFHRALFDNVVELNQVLNEVFNLSIDGAIGSVWGVRQVRSSYLANPEDAAGDIRQNTTLEVKSDLPPGQKVVENVAMGTLPPEALRIFELTSQEMNDASLTNDLKLASLSGRRPLATEVVEASQSYSTTLDRLIEDIDTECFTPAVRKLWMLLVQHLDKIDDQELTEALGDEMALAQIRALTPHERYNKLGRVKFSPTGVSALSTRSRAVQKMLSLIEVVNGKDWLLQPFLKEYSPAKIINQMVRLSGIDPQTIQSDVDEQPQMAVAQPGIGASALERILGQGPTNQTPLPEGIESET